MGYMGFGMRKEDWSRKPKEVFKKKKDLYGEKGERLPKPVNTPGPVTTNFSELFRMREQHEKRFHLGSTITKLVFGTGMLILLILLYMAMIAA